MRPSSLAGRLFLGAAVWLFLAIAVGGVVLAEAFRESVERGFEQRLESVLRAVVAGVSVTPGEVGVAPQIPEPRFEKLYSGWYWQVSAGSDPVARSRSLWDYAFPSRAAEAPGALHSRDGVGPRGEPVLIVERDIAFADRAEPLHVMVAASRAEIDAEVSGFRTLLALALGGLALGLLAATAIQVRYGLRPLRLLAADLERLRSGAGNRLGGSYPSEIEPLVEATNRVLAHDEALIERARTHVGNLAHALKTPLAILRAEAESRGGDPPIEAQVATMLRLVEHHLGRARAAASSAPAFGSHVAVADTTGELVAMMAKVFAEKRLEITAAIEPGLLVPIDREDFAEILGNLIENACKHAGARVRVSGRRDAGTVVVAVEDDGPGMDPQRGAVAARRGARLDEAHEGWGLGLSIVADLAALHGSELRFGRSELGGLLVELRVPEPLAMANRGRRP